MPGSRPPGLRWGGNARDDRSKRRRPGRHSKRDGNRETGSRCSAPARPRRPLSARRGACNRPAQPSRTGGHSSAVTAPTPITAPITAPRLSAAPVAPSRLDVPPGTPLPPAPAPRPRNPNRRSKLRTGGAAGRSGPFLSQHRRPLRSGSSGRAERPAGRIPARARAGVDAGASGPIEPGSGGIPVQAPQHKLPCSPSPHRSPHRSPHCRPAPRPRKRGDSAARNPAPGFALSPAPSAVAARAAATCRSRRGSGRFPQPCPMGSSRRTGSPAQHRRSRSCAPSRRSVRPPPKAAASKGKERGERPDGPVAVSRTSDDDRDPSLRLHQIGRGHLERYGKSNRVQGRHR